MVVEVTELAGTHRPDLVSARPRRHEEVVARPLGVNGLLAVAGAAVAWTGVVGAIALRRHDGFLSHRFDLGNVTQAVWSSAHGRLLEMTLGSGEQASRLAGHIDPALLLLVPFWLAYPAAETLIMVQVAALATGVYPVVRLALKYTGSRFASALLASWYFVFPWLVWNAFNDVHAVTFACPLLLYAIWFLDEDHLGRFASVAAVAMLTGELVGLTVAGLGVWYAVSHRRRLAGLSIAVLGTAWTALCVLLVIPAFNHGRPSPFYDRFESVGGSPTGLVVTLFTDPGTMLGAIASGADGRYSVLLLLPTALLALGTPLLLAAALPQFALNVLSDFWSTNQPMFQYVTPLIPLLVAASIMALGRLPRRARDVSAAAPLAAAIGCLIWVPPAPGSQQFVFGPSESPERIAAMREAIDLVPGGAPVTATNRIGAHLSARHTIYLVPERSTAQWAVLDTRDGWLQVAGERVDEPMFRELLAQFEQARNWRLVFDQADVRVYRRMSSASKP